MRYRAIGATTKRFAKIKEKWICYPPENLVVLIALETYS